MSLTYWVCCAGWLAGWWALGRPTPLDRADPRHDRHRGVPGSTTIVVPARNETASLGGLLSDLQREARHDAGLRVVVVDDSSEDDTADIARRAPGVELLEAPPLPQGWAGKCWAVDRGVAATEAPVDGAPADDDLLVLLDADVRLHPDSLDALRDEHRRSGGLVSVQPWHDTLRPYEQLSALFNVVALMGTGAGSAAPTGAFGPVLATTRADYHAVGGHEAVRDEVVEDLALARRYREAGRPVTVRTGGELITFRMYPTGLADLVDGWTKNFALGAGATPLPRLAAIVLWISAIGSASVAVVDAARGRTEVVLAVAAYLLVAAQLAVMFRRVGRFGTATALLHPVLVACFVAVFVRSLWRTHVRHNVEWRGRTITTSPRAATPRRP
ncbi:MAG: glycosyltransferase [Actinomycetota bacterium]|nr:glycosyltransferase [Actinomycetota bacterium]